MEHGHRPARKDPSMWTPPLPENEERPPLPGCHARDGQTVSPATGKLSKIDRKDRKGKVATPSAKSARCKTPGFVETADCRKTSTQLPPEMDSKTKFADRNSLPFT
jgi:hypothetical protein